jgi:hypothetical protein
MANGDGTNYLKPILIGVATLVLGAAIVGAASNSISNTVRHTALDVRVEVIEDDVKTQQQAVKDIPVMAEQIKDIKEDVGKILQKLEKE